MLQPGSPAASIRIAHAAGDLGEAQARAVAAALRRVAPEVSIIQVAILGDSGQEPSGVPGAATLSDALGRALRADLADIVVREGAHWPLRVATDASPTTVLRRDQPGDALVSRGQRPFSYLPAGAAIATSGVHRRAQLLRRRSDLQVTLTSDSTAALVRQLDAGAYEAAVVPASELVWLGLEARIAERVDTDLLIPAAGQGTLILQTLAEGRAADLAASVHHRESEFAWRAEQSCLSRLAPPPEAAVAVYAFIEDDDVFIHGIVAEPEGRHAARLRWRGPCRRAEEVGATMAELLLAAGGREILAGLPLESTGRYTFRVSPGSYGRSSSGTGPE